MTIFTVLVKGKTWEVHLLSPVAFIEAHSNDSDGLCVKEKRQLHFRTDHIKIGTIRHEVFHAFVTECCVDSLPEIEFIVAEEICAQLIDEHWDDMDQVSKEILEYLSPTPVKLAHS